MTRSKNPTTWEDRDLIDELLDVDHGLTGWEVGFVESIARQVIDEGRELSPKQRAHAEKLVGARL